MTVTLRVSQNRFNLGIMLWMDPYQAERTDPHACFRNTLEPNVRRCVDPRTPYGIPLKATPEGGTDSRTPRRRHTSQHAHLRNRQELVHRVLAVSWNLMAKGVTFFVGSPRTLSFPSTHDDYNRSTRTMEIKRQQQALLFIYDGSRSPNII